ncbi:hypothetical protein DV737_g1779, partial [Chaetothyriales sp. CBS 132003]
MGKGDSRSSDDLLSGYQKPKPIGLRILTVCLYTVSFTFLILVEICNIINKPLIRDTYWLKIGLANAIPNSVPNAVFINSLARSIGLHDFYQVGLWNFCEGYDCLGITYCSKPKTLYWFNPIEIIMNELLAGARIALPTEVTDALNLVRVASRWMFIFYLIDICLTFLCIFFVPMGFSKKPRWLHKAKRIFARQLPLSVLTFLALFFTAGPSAIGTVMFIILRNTFSGAADLNITAHLGTEMLLFTWISTCLNLIGFFMQIGTCCVPKTERSQSESLSPNLQRCQAPFNDETHNNTIEKDVIDLKAAIRACQRGERGAKREAKWAGRKLVRDLWTLEVAKYGGPCGMSRWDKKQMKAQAKALKWTIKAEIRGRDQQQRK